MLKKYVTCLKNGVKTQEARLLGRKVILTDGEIVSESILTQTFKSLFKEIKEDSKKEILKESKSEDLGEVLIDNSSDVNVVEKDELPQVKRGRGKRI